MFRPDVQRCQSRFRHRGPLGVSSRELCRADGQDGSFAAVTVEFISPARTLTAVEVDALSECEEF